MPGAAGTTIMLNEEDVPFAAVTVTPIAPDGAFIGTRALIWPDVAASAKIGAAVPPNCTDVPFTFVEANDARLFVVSKVAATTETMDPVATTPGEPKLAPFRIPPIAGTV